MARILLKKTLAGTLAPMDEEAEATLKKIKAGKDVWCEIRMARNPKQHRLYFGLLTLCYENLPERYSIAYRNFACFRKAVEMEAGHCEELVGLDGSIYRIPKSIAFCELDDTDFNQLFPRCIAICAELLSIESPELEQELLRYAA